MSSPTPSDKGNVVKRVNKLPLLPDENNQQVQQEQQGQQQLQQQQPQEEEKISSKISTNNNNNNNQNTKSINSTNQQIIIQNSLRKSLCHGIFSGQTNQTPSGPFVYVRSKWGKNLGTEDYIDQIFEALGISEPPLVFLTLACPEILPKLGLKRKPIVKNEDDMFDIVYDNPTEIEQNLFTNVMLSRMTSVVSSIAEASATCHSIFLCSENKKGNLFDEMILKSLPDTGIAISLTSLDFYSPEMMKDIDNSLSIADTPKIVRWSVDNDDNQDQNILSTGFSNYLIFQSVEDKTYFLTSIQQYLSVGLFCVGGTENLLSNSLKYIKTNSPLFVFKYTLCAGHCVSSLIEYYTDIQHKKYDTKSIEERVIPNHDNNYYHVDQNCLNLIQSIAYNWPNNSTLKNVVIINPLKQLLSSKLLEIIDIMSTKTSNNEYGGYMSDLLIKKQAVDMIDQISLLEKKFAGQVYIFTYIIITLSLLITLVAILQSDYQLYSRTYLEKYYIDKIYYYFTLVAPIILGILITISTTFNLENTWTLLTLARHKIIYSLYKFRCNTAEPANILTNRNKLSLRSQFAEDLQEIWQSISHLEISSDVLSKLSSNKPLDQIDLDNSISTKNILKQKNHKINHRLHKAKVSPKTNNVNETPDKNGPVVDLFDNDNDNDEFNENDLDDHLNYNMNNNNLKQALELNRRRLQLLLLSDDSIRNLTCEEYISERILPEIKKLENLTPKLLFIYRVLIIGVIVVSSVGTILTSNNVQVFIPVLFAFAHCFHQIISFHQLPLKIKRSNTTYTILKKILLWWSSLSLLEQMIVTNKNHLVETVEEVLLADIETITHARSKENQTTKKVTPGNKIDKKKKKKGKNKDKKNQNNNQDQNENEENEEENNDEDEGNGDE